MFSKICLFNRARVTKICGIHRRAAVIARNQSSGNVQIVETEYGPIRGNRKSSVLGRNYFNFQGIPYMKAPLGKLRFRDAQAPDKWIEPLDVTKSPPGYCMRQFLNYSAGGQEDAAILNVYTPQVEPKQPLPTMVWIHGGGWNSGSGQTDLFGCDYFMQKDVVLVTINYRLGPVGFLSLDDPELNIPGNAGLKDQVFALKWVQRNISSFGGDPNNVTVFGESAGGGSTHYHMLSHMSKGLFRNAIPMSGTAFCMPWSVIPRLDWSLRLAKQLGYSGAAVEKDVLAFLEKPDGGAIVKAAKKVLTFEEEIGLHILYAFGPVVEPYKSENCFIPSDPILMARDAWSKDVNVMIGATSNEGILRANVDADKISEILQNVNFFAPVNDLGIDVTSDKARAYGERIKKVYYGNSSPSATNQMPYLLFISDLYFWHPIQRALQSRLAHGGSGKNFFYRFDVDTSQNFVKKMHVGKDEYEKYPGASHCDELPYLFKTGPETKIISPAIESKEMEMIKVMTETFASFATSGDPTNHEIAEQWTAVDSNKLPFSCLNIGTNEIRMMPLPESTQLTTWNEIYAEEKVDLF